MAQSKWTKPTLAEKIEAAKPTDARAVEPKRKLLSASVNATANFVCSMLGTLRLERLHNISARTSARMWKSLSLTISHRIPSPWNEPESPERGTRLLHTANTSM